MGDSDEDSLVPAGLGSCPVGGALPAPTDLRGLDGRACCRVIGGVGAALGTGVRGRIGGAPEGVGAAGR